MRFRWALKGLKVKKVSQKSQTSYSITNKSTREHFIFSDRETSTTQAKKLEKHILLLFREHLYQFAFLNRDSDIPPLNPSKGFLVGPVSPPAESSKENAAPIR